MGDIVSEYLLSHTLEEVIEDWNTTRRLSSRDNYDGWINYVIYSRNEDPMSEIIWMTASKYIINDEDFRQRLLNGDEECFSNLKDKIFNEILNDSEYLNKLYKTGKKKEKQEQFKQDRSKYYL